MQGQGTFKSFLFFVFLIFFVFTLSNPSTNKSLQIGLITSASASSCQGLRNINIDSIHHNPNTQDDLGHALEICNLPNDASSITTACGITIGEGGSRRSRGSSFNPCFTYFSRQQTLGMTLNLGETSSQICHERLIESCQSNSCSQLSCEELNVLSAMSLPVTCLNKLKSCTKGITGINAPENETDAMIQTCEADAQAMNEACQKNPESMGATVKNLTNQVSQMSKQAGVNQCSQLAKAISGLEFTVNSTAQACQAYHSECQSSCQQAESHFKSQSSGLANAQKESYGNRLTSAKRECSRGGAHTASLQNQIQSLSENFQRTAACASLTSTQSSIPTFDQCNKNPSLAGCDIYSNVADCSNPRFATTHLACVCRSNPNDGRCQSFSKTGEGQLYYPNEVGGGATNSTPPFGNSGFGGSQDYIPPQSKGHTNAAQSPSPGQGSGGGLGPSGAQVNTPPEKWKPQPNQGSQYNTQVLRRGGGGGPGNFGNLMRGNGRGSPSGFNNDPSLGNTNENNLNAKKQGVDLTQFLPKKGFDPRQRGISSVTGPDGITGPFTDNFKKVNNRYVSIGNSLKP